MTARQFIRHGPLVPASVLHCLDEGRLVFFCGAGISMGTGLPDFRGLVRDVYDRCHQPMDPDGVPVNPAAREAVQREQYDKALEILERKEGEQRGPMRRAVMRRLLELPAGSNSLAVHRALLVLSSQKSRTGDMEGYRLVTTNFDSRFELAGLDLAYIEQAPRFGRPRPHSLRKVAYLHGRIEHEGL